MGTITRGTKAGGGTNLNSGQTADPAEVNTDFNTAYTEINGNLDNANIKPSFMATIYQAGCGRLTLSGSNLQYAPYNGAMMTLNSTRQIIPDAGVTLSASGLAASTTYYIYAYLSGGTLTLEAVTTTHATQATTGVEIKSGDGTRTLVGMARTTAGTAWADSATQRFVRSWFNDPGIGGFNGFTADRSTTSTAQPPTVELSTEIRVEMLLWANSIVTVTVDGVTSNSTANNANQTTLAFDGTTAEDVMVRGSHATAGENVTLSLGFTKTGLSEGYHYVTLLGAVQAGTGTWSGAAAGAAARRCTLSVRAR